MSLVGIPVFLRASLRIGLLDRSTGMAVLSDLGHPRIGMRVRVPAALLRTWRGLAMPTVRPMPTVHEEVAEQHQP